MIKILFLHIHIHIINYYAVRESATMKECVTTHIPSLLNVSNLLTKVLDGQKRRILVDELMFDLYEYDLN